MPDEGLDLDRGAASAQPTSTRRGSIDPFSLSFSFSPGGLRLHDFSATRSTGRGKWENEKDNENENGSHRRAAGSAFTRFADDELGLYPIWIALGVKYSSN